MSKPSQKKALKQRRRSKAVRRKVAMRRNNEPGKGPANHLAQRGAPSPKVTSKAIGPVSTGGPK